MAVGTRTIHNPTTRRLKITYTSCRIRLRQYSEALFIVIRDSVKEISLQLMYSGLFIFSSKKKSPGLIVLPSSHCLSKLLLS